MRVWQDEAKCRDMDPRLFDLDSAEFEEWKGRDNVDDAAYRLCEGCPAMRVCAEESLRPINMSRVVGLDSEFDSKTGAWLPDLVPTSGVVRGGAAVTTEGVFVELSNPVSGKHDPDRGWEVRT